MRPVLDLAPGAEHSPLAARLVEHVRRNLDTDPSILVMFRAMRASLAIVATDTADSITLRFDHGRLTIHDGIVGIPDASIRGSFECLLSLTRLPRIKGAALPIPTSSSSGKTQLRDLIASMRRGDLVVYGLALHPRMISRFLRLVAEPS